MSSASNATLRRAGHEPLPCTVIAVAADRATVTTQVGPAPLENGDRIELHVVPEAQSGIPPLRLPATVVIANGDTLVLAYQTLGDATARQLLAWFGKAAGASVALANPKNLLQELAILTISHLDHGMDSFVRNAELQLFEHAKQSHTNEEQTRLLELIALLKKRGEAIRSQTLANLQQRLEQTEPTPAKQAVSAQQQNEDLALVDREEFEDRLAIEIMIRRGGDQHWHALACLSRRYQQLLQHSVDNENLPVGVAAICYALQDSLRQQHIPRQHRLALYPLFERSVIPALGDLYDTLNGRLRSRGVLPTLETQNIFQTRSSGLTHPLTSPAIAATATENSAELQRGDNANVVALPGNEQLFNTVRNLLGLARHGGMETAQPSGAVLSATAAADHIAQLRDNAQARAALAQGADLRELLAADSAQSLSAETFDLLTLIKALFDSIGHYSHLSEGIQTLLQRLQIPVAQIALRDQQFFATAEHPARQLLNQMIDLSLHSEMPNPALETRFSTVVEAFENSAGNDIGACQQALQSLETVRKSQQSVQARNTQRVCQTYEGRQRIAKAGDAVERELQRRLAAPQVPEVAIELIDAGWRELLKITFIKLGPDSEPWREQLATLDQLLQWLQECLEAGQSSGALGDHESEIDSFVDLIGQQLDDIYPGDYRHHTVVEKLRETLKGHLPIALQNNEADQVTAPRTSNELLRELEAANPELSRWFKRALALKVGEEFGYLDDPEALRNIKLAWVSEDRQHFVFVNNRGQKVFDYDLVDIAHELSRGLHEVSDTRQWPLVERSLYATVQEAYQKLAYKSSHDELTGLINRKEVERLLADALQDAKSNWQHHCLLYLELDKFSLVNKLHGHTAGDQVLSAFSKLLEAQLPNDPVTGRVAGNEFVMLLYRHTESSGQQIAEKLMRAVREHRFQWQGNDIGMSASVGLVAINKFTTNVVELLRDAMTTCEAAKEAGGNRLLSFRYDAELHQHRDKLLKWINDLNHLLQGDQLVLRAQTIEPLKAGDEHRHYEILLAIRDENGNLGSPVEFIQAAECYNRMQRVDRWVIENTFKWLAELKQQGIQLPRLSINLSGNTINDAGLLDFLLEQFGSYKVPTEHICFEVTETATIANLAAAADFIREIKKLGCRFSLDDFGSGNASYQYLKYLPVDYLKIDGSFIRNIDTNADDYAMVKSINDIAHMMGKRTIAEFVENDAIKKILCEIGVDYGQGYGLGRPTPLTSLQWPAPVH